MKVGDSVAKGDILVDGAVELKNGSFLYSASKGKIFAKVKRTVTHSVNLEESIYIPTGEKKSKSVLSVFSVKLPVYLGKYSNDCYYVKKYKKEFVIDGSFLPF